MSKITIEELEKRAIHRSGIDLYNLEDAMLLIKLCQQESLPILGIDAFKICGEKIQPSMENSIDLSFEKESYHIAMRFLTDRCNLKFLYEIVY